MFFADGMKGSSQRVFHVTNDGVYPCELRNFATGRIASGDDHRVVVPSPADCLETFQSIGNNMGAWGQMAGCPCINSFQGE
jgi:hypothetical protein